MIIVVNAGLFFQNNNKEYVEFISECFLRISKKHPENKYFFFYEKAFTPAVLSSNIIPLFISYKLLFFKKLLLSKKISSLIKKNKADIFITNAEVFLKTKTPQFLIIQSSSDYIKKTFLAKATHIFTSSEFLKKRIIGNYNADTQKITALYNGIHEIFQPINIEEREKIKEQYAEGKEYFLVKDDISKKENFITLLKAFSVFKKKQKSNMLLVFITKKLSNQDWFRESLRLYKFSDGVKVLNTLSENESVKIIASSYAVISLFYSEENYITILQAIKCEVPLIANSTDVIKEVCDDAVLYADKNSYADIADKMMLIFKDEQLRQHKIEKANLQIKNYSWDKTADLFWTAILKSQE